LNALSTNIQGILSTMLLILDRVVDLSFFLYVHHYPWALAAWDFKWVLWVISFWSNSTVHIE
jgi:hypothetical protein